MGDAGFTLSTVIPTWCEAGRIVRAVRLARELSDEVIVADGGSPDDTARLARAAGAKVVFAAKGRGTQLHGGAREARGSVLLFLHADSELEQPALARAAIQRALGADPAILGGNFYLRFAGPGRAARLFTHVNDLRRRWLRIYYGDSAIFVRRAVYERLGGFRPMPLLEDYDFVRRLERTGQTAYLRHVTISTSARRFDGRLVQTLASWVLVQGLFLLGVEPQRLVCFYPDRR